MRGGLKALAAVDLVDVRGGVGGWVFKSVGCR